MPLIDLDFQVGDAEAGGSAAETREHAEGLDGLGRIDVAAIGLESTDGVVLDLDAGGHLTDLVRVHQVGFDAEADLHLQVAVQLSDALLVAAFDHGQHAGAAQAEGAAGGALDVVIQAHRVARHARQGPLGVGLVHDGTRAAGGARTQLALLDEDDGFFERIAALGGLQGDAGAHGTAADDQYFAFHGGLPRRTRPIGLQVPGSAGPATFAGPNRKSSSASRFRQNRCTHAPRGWNATQCTRRPAKENNRRPRKLGFRALSPPAPPSKGKPRAQAGAREGIPAARN
ncbi:MAG: hypothetical protein R3F17_01205 [Planctomycetota bacterium]